jgi:hypothetical protein
MARRLPRATPCLHRGAVAVGPERRASAPRTQPPIREGAIVGEVAAVRAIRIASATACSGASTGCAKSGSASAATRARAPAAASAVACVAADAITDGPHHRMSEGGNPAR